MGAEAVTQNLDFMFLPMLSGRRRMKSDNFISKAIVAERLRSTRSLIRSGGSAGRGDATRGASPVKHASSRFLAKA
jgi:hypothetical protein